MGRVPGIGLLQSAPNTARFVAASWSRGREVPHGDVPSPRLSPALVLQVAMDEALIGVMKSPRRYPRRDDYARVGPEIHQACELYRSRGWLDDPRSYHDTPSPVSDPVLERAAVRGLSYERLSFESGYEPHAGEPGRERWLAHEANRTAYAWVLRHPGPPRPWLVCVHGFGTGSPMMDFPGFRAARLHRQLGLNLLLPVLPMHGPRRVGRSGEAFMSFDLVNIVHGFAQATWDIRRAIGWARDEGAEQVGVYGLSLGGYTAALLTGIEPGLEMAIAGIPCTDIPDLFRHHSPPAIRRRALDHGILGPETDMLHRVVSPLVIDPLVAHERRFIFAGLGDRMSTAPQAHRLWLHWDKPTMAWYGGNHVGFMWSRQVSSAVDAALRSSGFVG